MDSLIPVILVAAPLLTAASLLGLSRTRLRTPMLWTAAAALMVGLWVLGVSMISRLPLQTTWTAWRAVSGVETGQGLTWYLLDAESWALATILLTLSAAAVLSALVRIGEAHRQDLAWMAVFTGIGVAACTAASFPSLMLAWAGLDLAVLAQAFLQEREGDPGGRLRAAAGYNLLATTMILLAVAGWPASGWGRTAVPEGAALVMIASAGLRLAAAARSANALGEGLLRPGMIGRLASCAAALAILVRVASAGGLDRWAPGAAAFAAILALAWAFLWLIRSGGPGSAARWLAGLAALAAMAAVLGLPGAAIRFSILALAGAGLMELPAAGPGAFRWLVFFVAVLASGIPFSPGWPAAELFETPALPWGIVAAAAFGALLAGLIWRPGSGAPLDDSVVPGVRSIHTGALVLVVVGLVITGWAPILVGEGVPGGWWGGGLVVLFTAGWSWVEDRGGEQIRERLGSTAALPLSGWLRRLRRRLVGGASFGLNLLARMLEGEGALLWAIVLLSLIISLFVQLGLGV